MPSLTEDVKFAGENILLIEKYIFPKRIITIQAQLRGSYYKPPSPSLIWIFQVKF